MYSSVIKEFGEATETTVKTMAEMSARLPRGGRN
jgi:hypothetical protein